MCSSEAKNEREQPVRRKVLGGLRSNLIVQSRFLSGDKAFKPCTTFESAKKASTPTNEVDSAASVDLKKASKRRDCSYSKDTACFQHLPPKLTMIVCCTLTHDQRIAYETVLAKYDRQLGGSVSQECVESLQKICNHPALLVSADDNDTTVTKEPTNGGVRMKPMASGKMRVLHALLCRWYAERKERCIIVSAFMATLELIADMCRDEGWPCCEIVSSTPLKCRERTRDRFNDISSGCFALLLSSKTGDINLIGGSRLIMFDDLNPDKQACIWRDGQQRQCYAYRLVSTGTLEERMLQLGKCSIQEAMEDEDLLTHLVGYTPNTPSVLYDHLRCKMCRHDPRDTSICSPSNLLTPAAAAEALGVLEARLPSYMMCPTVKARLQMRGYDRIPHILRDLRKTTKNQAALDAAWSLIAQDLRAANDRHKEAPELVGKNYDYPMLIENDLITWEQHPSVATVPDEALREASSDNPGTVSFVFALCNDWKRFQPHCAPIREQPTSFWVEKPDPTCNDQPENSAVDDVAADTTRADCPGDDLPPAKKKKATNKSMAYELGQGQSGHTSEPIVIDLCNTDGNSESEEGDMHVTEGQKCQFVAAPSSAKGSDQPEKSSAADGAANMTPCGDVPQGKKNKANEAPGKRLSCEPSQAPSGLTSDQFVADLCTTHRNGVSDRGDIDMTQVHTGHFAMVPSADKESNDDQRVTTVNSCPKCTFDNDISAKNCDVCGTRLRWAKHRPRY